MRGDSRGVGGVHLLVVIAGAAVVAPFQRGVEEPVTVGVGLHVAGGRAAVDAALVPALLQGACGRARPAAALAAHVHDRATDLTNHASLLNTRTVSPHPYPHLRQSIVRKLDHWASAIEHHVGILRFQLVIALLSSMRSSAHIARIWKKQGLYHGCN